MLKNYYYFTPFLCTILALSWLLPFFTDAGVFSNAGLEVYLLRLVRCLFPYYFGFSFISPASDNSPNISLSYACCFLGHCQWHGHVLIRFSMTLLLCPQQPLAGACCLSKVAKLGILRQLQGFTCFHLFHLSMLKYIAYVWHAFVEYSVFRGSATPVPRLLSSPGKPIPSEANGNCSVHQNELLVESRLPSYCSEAIFADRNGK